MPNQRQQLGKDDLEKALTEVVNMLFFRARQKGMGSMASNHEILGILSEEFAEYRDAVHAKGNQEEKVNELIDIAVAALFGIASIRSNGIDW
jgi:hypothetical protein